MKAVLVVVDFLGNFIRKGCAYDCEFFLVCGPGVSLTLCCFVVYSTRRFVLCLTLCHFVLVFFSPFSIAITSLGKERELILVIFVRLFDLCLDWICLDLSVSSSSWCLGRAAVCNCGTPLDISLVL